ncbi:sugar-transfer associated ATP-grasp domain-containing protein [Saccharicrinis sp. 156]|uniref:sugar-transfer associated ATP-grasp domain-containing protein n=1 Tax=Saccharicrinis sp. 156 TaxID=3417574 RepID=UPI003D338D28
MKLLKRFVYLIYYIKNGELNKGKLFSDYASHHSGKSRLRLLEESVINVFKYNVSIKDYYQFRFFELSEAQKSKWAGSGFMYEYQLKMNPKRSRTVLENKVEFLECYHKFIRRNYTTINEIKTNNNKLESLLENPSGKLVLKGSMGQVGAEVEVINCSAYTANSLFEYMKDNKYDMVEEFVVQHDDLMELSPAGLNTIRIFTQLNNGIVDILGARLRITVNSPVDNMAAGNLAAPIDYNTGVINGSAVYSDITKADCRTHPVSNKEIIGFHIPYWDETKKMVEDAALHNTSNKSIGWDIAISNKGPELIEGNHNWCKLLWQLPVKTGLKGELLKYV